MIEIKKRKKEFVECFNIISNLVIETDINFSNDKIYIKAVHPSNHCMLMLEIKSSFFDNYNIEKDCIYTLDMFNLIKILKIVSKKDMIIDSSADKLILKNESSKYELNYFVGSKDTRETPSFEYENNITLTSDEFFEQISKALVIDQIGEIKIVDGELFISSKSHMISGESKLKVLKVEGQNNNSFFDLSYIELINGIKNIFTDIEIGFSNELPLTIKCKNDDMNCKFILANRIE